jgi:hypothetical protein
MATKHVSRCRQCQVMNLMRLLIATHVPAVPVRDIGIVFRGPSTIKRSDMRIGFQVPLAPALIDYDSFEERFFAAPTSFGDRAGSKN